MPRHSTKKREPRRRQHINLLPHELIADILHHAVLCSTSIFDCDMNPMVLASVCHLWLSIVQSTASLWTSISYRSFYHPDTNRQPYRRVVTLDWIKTCLKYSKEAKLNVRIIQTDIRQFCIQFLWEEYGMDISEDPSRIAAAPRELQARTLQALRTHMLEVERIFVMIVPHLERVRALEFRILDKASGVLPLEGPLASLKYLSAIVADGEITPLRHPIVTPKAESRLEFLLLGSYAPLPPELIIRIPSDDLTEVSITNPHPFANNLIGSCPNLTTLKLLNVTQIPAVGLIAHKLETIYISGTTIIEYLSMVHAFTLRRLIAVLTSGHTRTSQTFYLPSIRTLEWKIPCQYSQNSGAAYYLSDVTNIAQMLYSHPCLENIALETPVAQVWEKLLEPSCAATLKCIRISNLHYPAQETMGRLAKRLLQDRRSFNVEVESVPHTHYGDARSWPIWKQLASEYPSQVIFLQRNTQ